MVKVEVFYNGETDRLTPEKAKQLHMKYGGKIDLYVVDISEESAPEAYGTINAPIVVLDGKQVFKLEGTDSLSGIVSKAIF